MKNKYSQEYKTSAVKMVLEEGRTPTEVSLNLGVPVGLLYKWIRKYKGIDPKGKTDDFQEENKRLKNEDERLSALIIKSFNNSRQTYGTERIQQDLRELGEKVSRRRIGSLMRKAGLVCKTVKKFKATTNSKHNKRISLNLLKRKFKVDVPNKVWVGDITYIWTDEGWFYLATVIDLFSRKVVGWSMANHMRTSLINDAMQMAIWQRKPPKGLV